VSISQTLSSLGVPEGAGASNGTVQTRISLHNETQLKDLLDIGLSPQQRAQHAGALLDGITAPAGQPHVPLLHALIRHVVGNDELSAQDRAQLAPAFPITARVLTQQPAAAPMQVNDVWDVSTPDGTLKVIDLPNGIELQDGGCIVARSTPLHFTCSSFTRTGGPPAGYSGDFNILGTTGAPVPAPPVPQATPAQAPNGAPGECSSAGIAGDGGQAGAPGQPGAAGAAGLPGNNGIASAIATITITRRLTLTGATRPQLIVATQSGPGGDGGNGGQGGPGQQGGNGGNGALCGCTGSAGGGAGNGGQGGTGGPAGDGGNGTDAAGNIAVHVPKGVRASVVQPLPVPAPPGQPGNPGPGALGGAPGQPGAGGKYNPGGSPAGPGSAGDPGAPGNPGTRAGTAAKVTVVSH
jgi:hypothetical protein